MNPRLATLVLIKMGLDWEQLLRLAPVLRKLEELHLVRNQCHGKIELGEGDFACL